jgi:cytochrome c
MSVLSRIAVAASVLGVLSGPALSEGDPERGEALYRPCAACHMIGEGAIHRIGPHLNGIVGRGIGMVEGYRFSEIFEEAAAAGEVWTEMALDGFIANPGGYLPGTSMVFRGIRGADDRADLIAFLIQEGGSAEAPAAAGEDTGPPPEVAAILEYDGDVAYGQFLSSECTACHIGQGGDDIPSIRGLTPTVFIAGMVAYRSGERQHQVMNTLAARLGDEEIAALAAYFLSENN